MFWLCEKNRIGRFAAGLILFYDDSTDILIYFRGDKKTELSVGEDVSFLCKKEQDDKS